MASFFVSAAGNDSNAGTSTGLPWLTIGKVNAHTFSAGDTVSFRGGDTFTDATLTPGQSGSVGSPITFTSYSTGRATISRTASSGFSAGNKSYITLSNLNFTGSGGTTTSGVVFSYSTGSSNGIVINNLDVSGFASSGIFVDCSGGGQLTGLTISNCNAHGNTATNNSQGLGTAGILCYGVYGAQVSTTYQLHTVLIQNCTAHDNLGCAGDTNWNGSGIFVGESDSATITQCTAYNNGVNSTNLSGPIGIWFGDTKNGIISFCESYNNHTGTGTTDGGGFDMDGGCVNCTIEYCYAHGNDGNGFANYTYDDPGKITGNSGCTIRYCVSESDAHGRIGQGGILVGCESSASNTGIAVYGCTVYGATAVSGQNCLSAFTHGGTLSGYVANNIFYATGSVNLVGTTATNPSSVSLLNNDYFTTGSFNIYWNSTNYSTFAAWQTATGQEKISGVNVGLTSNPLLTNPGGGGTCGTQPPQLCPSAYVLQSGSPMRRAGLDLTQAPYSFSIGSQDYYGNTIVGGNLSVGAYSQTGYYVATAGSDSNTGFFGSPWKTIAHVNAQTFGPGNTISFNGGNTFNDATLTPVQSGTSQNPIVFNSYGVGQGTISPPNTSSHAIFAHVVAYVQIDNLIGLGLSSSTGASAGIYFSNDDAGATLYDGNKITRCTVSNFSQAGIYVGGDATTSGFSNFLIDNCTVHNVGREGVIAYGFTANARVHPNLTITNSLAYSTGFSGIVMGNVGTGLMQNCTAHDTGALSTAGPIGLWTYESDSVVIRNCESYNNVSGNTTDGGGFGIDEGATNCTIEYCYSHGNVGAGFLVYASTSRAHSGHTVRFCISQNDGSNGGVYAGITINSDGSASSTGLDVYGNTLYNSLNVSGAIVINDSGCTGYIANNIFYSASNTPLAVASAPGSISLLNNDYFATGTFTINWNGTPYSTFSAWQTATGQEKIGSVNVGKTSNPLLTNPGGGGTCATLPPQPCPSGYVLQSNSPMVGTGLNLTQAPYSLSIGSQDYYGNPINPVGLNIGAYSLAAQNPGNLGWADAGSVRFTPEFMIAG